MPEPGLIDLDWLYQYRVISSEFPPINFFEELVSAELMDDLYYIESLTNDRLRDETGDISLVAQEDRISGPGSSPVMAAFTHVSSNYPSRFSNGDYGVYYAAENLATAIAETRFHRARFLSYTAEDPGEIDMRSYIGKVIKPMHDIRDGGYEDLHDAHDWSSSQVFGENMRATQSWGIVYHSVRNPGHDCIAVLRPRAITRPIQGPHLCYVWDGKGITHVYEKRLI